MDILHEYYLIDIWKKWRIIKMDWMLCNRSAQPFEIVGQISITILCGGLIVLVHKIQNESNEHLFWWNWKYTFASVIIFFKIEWELWSWLLKQSALRECCPGFYITHSRNFIRNFPRVSSEFLKALSCHVLSFIKMKLLQKTDFARI